MEQPENYDNIMYNELVDLYKRVSGRTNFTISRNNLIRNNNFVDFLDLVKYELQGIQSETTSPLIKQYVQEVLETGAEDNVINRIDFFINQELPYFTYPTQNVPWTLLTPNNSASNYNNTNNNNSIIEPGAPQKRGRPNNNGNNRNNNNRQTRRRLTFPDPPSLSSLPTLPNNSQEGGKRRAKKTRKQRKQRKQKKTQRKHR
jgi:hypothetical protein